MKGLVTRNTLVQYESPISSRKKVIAKVKVFQKKVKLQGQGHEVKNYGTMWKVLSQGIHMCNIKTVSLMVRKLWPRLKSFKRRSRSRRQKLWYHVKGLVTRNMHVLNESSISYVTKVMAKVKVFVHASNADADTRAMTLAPRTFVSAR